MKGLPSFAEALAWLSFPFLKVIDVPVKEWEAFCAAAEKLFEREATTPSSSNTRETKQNDHRYAVVGQDLATQ